MIFEDLYMKHNGCTAVIFGKGPSLDLWIKNGKPLPGNNITIGINSTGLVYGCNYNITRHNRKLELADSGQSIFPITDGWELSGSKYVDVVFRKVPDGALWFIPIPYKNRVPSREEMRDCRVMVTPGGSCVNAIMLAYYTGASDILFIGVDGDDFKESYSESFKEKSKIVPDTLEKYKGLKAHSNYFANVLFKGRFKYWTQDLK